MHQSSKKEKQNYTVECCLPSHCNWVAWEAVGNNLWTSLGESMHEGSDKRLFDCHCVEMRDMIRHQSEAMVDLSCSSTYDLFLLGCLCLQPARMLPFVFHERHIIPTASSEHLYQKFIDDVCWNPLVD